MEHQSEDKAMRYDIDKLLIQHNELLGKLCAHITRHSEYLAEIEYSVPDTHKNRLFFLMPYEGVLISFSEIDRFIANSGTDPGIAFYKVIYSIEGRLEVYLPGMKKYAYMEPGMIAVDKSDPDIRFVLPDRSYKQLGIYFSFDLMEPTLRETLGGIGITAEAFEGLIRQNGACTVGIAAEKWKNTADELCRYIETSGGDSSILFRFRLLTIELMAELVSGGTAPLRPESYASPGHRRIVFEAAGIIDGNFSSSFTIEELAEKVGSTASSLKKYFRSIYGIPIHRYIRSKRIEKAKQLLSSTDMSIAQITEAVGYESHSKFSVLFREITGETPSEYRRLNKK